MTHRLIVREAKQLAGTFYGLERTDTFRASWPSENEYVRVKWPHFVQFVRTKYAELLGRPDVSDRDKEEIFEALTADAGTAVSDGAASPIQLAPGTQGFEGDRFDNRKLNALFGREPQSTAKRLKTTTALFPT